MREFWRAFLVLLAAAIFLPLLALAQAPERTHDITIDDYLTVHLIVDVATSPDGKYVAFSELRWGDHDKPRTTDIWVVDTEKRRPVRLTFDPASDHSPQWGADSQHLYFLTKRDRGDERPPYDGSKQVWVMGTHPSEPLPITRVKDGVHAYQLSKDGRTLYYTKGGEEAELPWADLRGKYSDVEFDFGPITYTELWKLDLETWRAEKLIAEKRVITEFKVTDDESRIAMITTPDGRLVTKEGQSRVDLYDVRTKQITTLPDGVYRATAPSPFGWLDNLAWSSDGTLLACTVGFDGYPTEVVIHEWLDGDISVRLLQRPGEVHVWGNLFWISGTQDLCFLAEDHARRRMYCVKNVRDGGQGSSHELTAGDVVVHGYSYSADGNKIALIKSDTENCRDVYWYDSDKPSSKLIRLTEINPQMDTWKLPQISHVTWFAPDGTEVGGILELPPGYSEGDGPLPMAVELHGGPTDCTKLHLRYWIYGRTIFAARGWALLSPNYRGSTGYGDKFLTDLVGHENDIEVKDVLAGVDAMVARGIADPQRLGVLGWSNGGFLTNCLIVTTDRFKAASSGAGTIDMFMQWGMEDTPGHVVNYMRGLPWQAVDAYVKASPGYNLGKVTTPTLIHVGEKDARVPAAHSRSLYRGLKDFGNVDTVLLTYPGAGHGLVISDHRKGKLEWDVRWFDKYVLGKEAEE